MQFNRQLFEQFFSGWQIHLVHLTMGTNPTISLNWLQHELNGPSTVYCMYMSVFLTSVFQNTLS